jgi:tetratricopeptide (TPR) repeat protein
MNYTDGTESDLLARMKAARRLYDGGHDEATVEAVLDFLDLLPAEGVCELRDEAVVLGLFAFARGRNYEGGWSLVERFGGPLASLDFCYAACYLAYRRADAEAVEVWGRRYVRQHSTLGEGARLSSTAGKTHEVFNTLGCSARDRGDHDAARAYLQTAMEHAPNWPLPYLNLAGLARRRGHMTEARRIIQQGLTACGDIEELRLFDRNIPAEPRISLCMIVRDEEAMLPAALESVKGTVDEIVVVDTGSTDRTVEIARSFGARVYHHPWNNDFSAARNVSIGYATGDWVLILDADERLDGSSAAEIRGIAAGCAHEAISFSIYNVDLDSDSVSFLPGVRMFRNGRGYGYTGIVHNQLDLPDGCPVLCAPLKIHHFGYTPSIVEARGKFHRTTALLQKQLEADPDDAFAHFNMAQIMRGRADAKRYAPDVLEHARRVTELIRPEEREHRHVLLMAYHQLATSYLLLGDYARAEGACREALAIKPDFMDALFTLGQTLHVQKHYGGAREALLQYLSAREAYCESEEAAGFILLSIESRQEAYYNLGLIDEALGEHARAQAWYDRVLESGQAPGRLHPRESQVECVRTALGADDYAHG